MQNIVLKNEKLFFRNFMGLFAIISNVINTIRFLKENNLDFNSNLYVELIKNSAYYHHEITETDNVWEYYFEQPCEIDYNNINKSLYTFSSPFYMQDNFVARLHTKHTHLIKNELIYLNKCVFHNSKNRIKLKKIVEDKIEEMKIELGLHNSKYIGVHFRYFKIENPNHFKDGHIGNRPEFNLWFKHIDKILTNKHKIFLATDDEISLNAFINKYGDKLVYNKTVDRTFTRDIENSSFNPVHSSEVDMKHFIDTVIYSNRTKNPYEIGMDAIIDSYILSNSDVLIRQCSGLSFFSMIINPHINVINIDTY